MTDGAGEEAEQEVAVDDHEADEADENGLEDEDEHEESDESAEDGLEDEDEREDELDSEEALRNAIAQLQAGAQELNLGGELVEDAGAAVLATVLATNRTLKKLLLHRNRIGPVGARSLAAALDNNATLTSLDLDGNNIGAEGARSLAAALDNNATCRRGRRLASERRGACSEQRARAAQPRRQVQRACAPASRGRRRGARARARRASGRPSRRGSGRLAGARSGAARQEQRRPALDMLYVVGLGLGDKKDITVKSLEACIGPFDAFDSAVRHGRSEHAAQTTKVARGR